MKVLAVGKSNSCHGVQIFNCVASKRLISFTLLSKTISTSEVAFVPSIRSPLTIVFGSVLFEESTWITKWSLSFNGITPLRIFSRLSTSFSLALATFFWSGPSSGFLFALLFLVRRRLLDGLEASWHASFGPTSSPLGPPRLLREELGLSDFRFCLRFLGCGIFKNQRMNALNLYRKY